MPLDYSPSEHPLNPIKLWAEYTALISDRTEYEQEWRQISEWLLPARGIYQLYTKPRKKKLSLSNIINPAARESLRVLTSGLQGSLTSPSRPWYNLDWEDERISKIKPLETWLNNSRKALNSGFTKSNFYQIIHSFYTELAGFGTAVIYVGEDGLSDKTPFRFESLTAGEFAYTTIINGGIARFFRTIFFTARQLVDNFDREILPLTVLQEAGRPAQQVQYYTVLQSIIPYKHGNQAFTSIYYLLSGTAGMNNAQTKPIGTPLRVSGFHEMPYFVGRWELVGQDVYGLGAGSEALSNIKRLQEMEKSFLIATHKSINPPLNAPARLRGKITTLPGGINYYQNVNETVTSMYTVDLNFEGVTAAIERVEESINKIFYNDLFLTASRDPDASPLRTGEVNAKQDEAYQRMGPIVQRVQFEVLKPIVERCFNIMLRKNLFDPLDPEMSKLAGDYSVAMISPLAMKQKLVEASSIERYLQATTFVSQINPTALDKVNTDEVMNEFADIISPPDIILRTQEEVDAIRKQRAQQEQAEKERVEGIENQQASAETGKLQSETAKNFTDAGVNITDALETPIQ